MPVSERDFIGEWRQLEPRIGREDVFIRFEADGTLQYIIESETTQTFLLTWRLEGDVIVSDQPSAPRPDVTRFRFASPSRLVLERKDESYIYERCIQGQSGDLH